MRAIGDWVEIICTDGTPFSGVLMYDHPDYIVLNGYGFPKAGFRYA